MPSEPIYTRSSTTSENPKNTPACSSTNNGQNSVELSTNTPSLAVTENGCNSLVGEDHTEVMLTRWLDEPLKDDPLILLPHLLHDVAYVSYVLVPPTNPHTHTY